MKTYNELNRDLQAETDPAKQQAILEHIQSLECHIEREFKFQPNNIDWLRKFLKADSFYAYADLSTFSAIELRDEAYQCASKKMERERREEFRDEKDIEFHPEHDNEEEEN